MTEAPPYKDVKDLMNACWDGDTARIDAFFDKYGNGAIEVTKGEPVGWTGIMWASRSGNVDSIATLIARGANVNKPDRDGRTPLMMAAARNNVAAMKLLLEHGADAFAVDGEDLSAAVIARRSKSDGAAELLEGIIAAHEKAMQEAARKEQEAIAHSAHALQDDMRQKSRRVKILPGRKP